jgi:hypothetical protein
MKTGLIPITSDESLVSFARRRLCNGDNVKVRINDAMPTPQGKLRDETVKKNNLVVVIDTPQSPGALADLCSAYSETLQCIGVVQVTRNMNNEDFAIVVADTKANNRFLVPARCLNSPSQELVQLGLNAAWPVTEGVPKPPVRELASSKGTQK